MRGDAVALIGGIFSGSRPALRAVARAASEWKDVTDLAPGIGFAGCRVEEILGTGGMGVIYRATELRLGRPVALKLIAADGASDPALRERFEREARLTASIAHPNVIPVYAAGEE